MNAVRTSTLEAPAKNYGAELKPQYIPAKGWRAVAFGVALLVAMICAPHNTFLFIPADEKAYGVMWIIGAFFVLLSGAGYMDSRHQNETDFYYEKRQMRYNWVTSTLREYIETIYDAKISPEEMHYLWRGGETTIRVQGTYIKVRLEGSQTINDYATGRINRFYPEDLALMEVIEPAKVSYRQIPTVM